MAVISRSSTPALVRVNVWTSGVLRSTFPNSVSSAPIGVLSPFVIIAVGLPPSTCN